MGCGRRVVVAIAALMVVMGVLPASAVAAEVGRPGRPNALTVDGVVAPIGVDPDGVAFAWHVTDGRRGARQAGFRILVARSATSDPRSKSVFWDSGDVRSAQQAFVAYGGPRLEADAEYWWTVATRDGDGVAGSFARPQGFVTGLRDGDWQAQWVRPGPAGPQAEELTYVRKDVRLRASPIVRATAYVAAEHKYELSINGERADSGPSFAYPDEQYYQATDVTRLMHPRAANAFGVLHHWYGAGQGRPASEPALIVQLSVLHRDGTHEVVGTDGTWLERAAEWRSGPPRNEEGDFVEDVDGRATPAGWAEPGYDAASWSPVAVLGPAGRAPFGHLAAQPTRIVERAMRPMSVSRPRSGTVVADFGAVVAATPTVTFRHGTVGHEVAMHVGFLLDRNGRVSTTRGTQGTNLSYSYVERAGTQTFRPYGYLGFRYLEIDAPGEHLGRDQVIAYVRHSAMPTEAAATFSSSNRTLDRVWQLTMHSALYSAQEQFVDTPTREKGQFLADAFNESQAAMHAFGEQNLTRKGLHEFARSQARYWPDGRVNAVYPNGDGARDIPDFTELYPEWLWQYYRATSDRTTLAELYPVVARIADYIWRAVDPATGLVTRLPGGGEDYLYGIVDAPPAMRYGYDMNTVARTTINVLGANVFNRTGQIANLLGHADDAAIQQTRSQALTAAINERLVRQDGVYIDGLDPDGSPSQHASQQANALALAFGVVSPDRVSAVGAYVARLGIAVGPVNGLSAPASAAHVTPRQRRRSHADGSQGSGLGPHRRYGRHVHLGELDPERR